MGGRTPAETLRSELAAFGALPVFLRASDSTASPDLVMLGVAALSATEDAAEYNAVLKELDAALPDLLSAFDTVYGTRSVVEIVLMANDVVEDEELFVKFEAPSATRVSRRLQNAPTSATGFENSD